MLVGLFFADYYYSMYVQGFDGKGGGKAHDLTIADFDPL